MEKLNPSNQNDQYTDNQYASDPNLNISGLLYIPNFITKNDHAYLWETINNEIWLNDLKRRVQHYGYRYDYKRRFLDYSMYLGDLPRWATIVAGKIVNCGLMSKMPDQVIVNEYLPGQGIADHIDCEPCFEDQVISLSLGSTCVMDLKNRKNRLIKHELFLEPRSLVVLSGEARYDWTHGIAGRISDKRGSLIIPREVRISLTFRKVIV